ncbi:hypothetical protein BI49514_03190 [Brevibacterium iodinum ATCC 49514]|uniref:Uncharacterized protein n=1 Tax=Brevibacterium iodinum ATCC 49514 TaxID=1255616 RepID=A0A2H1KMT3_9MICO|nr:hypothetical protein [Brevibacterium iodinum]SMY01057.1 hypothetical protein BI49514_03190 [Brevibacterium iodinum ATCC 49514]SUW14351.1 Uncharacterised protein [Brevibacterium iodinum]
MLALSILAALVALGERTTSDSTARSDSADQGARLGHACRLQRLSKPED